MFLTEAVDEPCKCGGKRKAKRLLADFDDQLEAENYVWSSPRLASLLSVGLCHGWESDEVRYIDC